MGNNVLNNDSVVRIKIVGVGGGGNNAIDRMIDENIPMVEYVAINTDDASHGYSRAETKVQIGRKETKGRGAGSIPEVGKCSAEENIKEIEEAIKNCEMLFITAGMGGGTGTGAAPVVAEIASKLGILTVAVVTKPFTFEGKRRMDNALSGIAEIEKYADAVIIIPNDNLKNVSDSRITLSNAFAIADSVLVNTVKNMVEVVQKTAYINCDFADITSIIQKSGTMHTATGKAKGDNRADKIIEHLLNNRLLDTSVKDATGILICITASSDTGLDEIDKISTAISEEAQNNATIIFGMDFDDNMQDEMRTILIATKKRIKHKSKV